MIEEEGNFHVVERGKRVSGERYETVEERGCCISGKRRGSKGNRNVMLEERETYIRMRKGSGRSKMEVGKE